MGEYRVALVGPRVAEITASALGWVETELRRTAVRLAQRHRGFVAVASLAPGLGAMWIEAARAVGAPYEAWVPHPGMFEHWPHDQAAAAYGQIGGARSLVVPFAARERFDPRMHPEVLRLLSASVDAEALVWSGDRSDYYFAVTRSGAKRPTQVINFKQRSSRWSPGGL